MAKDYKHRAQNPRYKTPQHRKKSPNILWRWLLVVILIIAFVAALNMIGRMLPNLIANKQELAIPPVSDPAKPEKGDVAASAEKPEKKEDEEPRYDFYTILPQAETVIPDYEIKTRVREELVGKSKTVKYAIQAGSFRELTEAERHKAKLALLGIESRIERAKVDNLAWYRIKIGPYDNPSSVSTIKDLLQKNGIGVVVTAIGQ